MTQKKYYLQEVNFQGSLFRACAVPIDRILYTSFQFAPNLLEQPYCNIINNCYNAKNKGSILFGVLRG